MGKIRVYELAKELEMESKDVIRRLGKMGAEVKNHMSTVDDQHVQMLRDIVRPKLMNHKGSEQPAKAEIKVIDSASSQTPLYTENITISTKGGV